MRFALSCHSVRGWRNADPSARASGCAVRLGGLWRGCRVYAPATRLDFASRGTPPGLRQHGRLEATTMVGFDADLTDPPSTAGPIRPLRSAATCARVSDIASTDWPMAPPRRGRRRARMACGTGWSGTRDRDGIHPGGKLLPPGDRRSWAPQGSRPRPNASASAIACAVRPDPPVGREIADFGDRGLNRAAPWPLKPAIAADCRIGGKP